ncbi:MAG: GspE/PulE family protein [Patescibacteria group bacterium]
MDTSSTIPVANLGQSRIPFDALKYIPEDSAGYYKFIPIDFQDGILQVGMVDPDNMEARDALQFIASKGNIPFKIFLVSEADFASAMKSYEGLGGQVDKALDAFEAGVEADKKTATELIKDGEQKKGHGPSIIEEAPVTKIVGVILQHAAEGNASDIHIEPIVDKVKVRFRVDGILYTSLFLPKTVHDAVVARIKILTNMKLDEKRKPQDGRFSAKIEGRKIDFRVSTFPTYFGEKVVLRILDPEKKLVSLESVGLSGPQLTLVQSVIKKPHGLILLTGPTGSGKTTTLYSMLNSLEKEKYNVVSLEDPIEYDIEGINQSQVQAEIDYTFANGLRSILRQDPDIIMVGEIRDKETAKLAIQASLTGHLVFSTIHTNSAIGVVHRLVDMGVDPYLIPPTLVMAIGQRLVPLLIPEAREAVPVEDSLRVMIDKQFEDLPAEYKKDLIIPDVVYEAKAIPSSSLGTKGRTAVFEFIEMDRELERLVLKSPSEEEIYTHVRAKGFTTMKEDAMRKSFAGLIAFAEVNKL